MTVIGTPALAFNGNFGFLQVVLGYLLARIIISALFLPQYFRGEMFTAEEQAHGFFNRSPWQNRTLYRADEFLASLGYLTGKPTLKVPSP